MKNTEVKLTKVEVGTGKTVEMFAVFFELGTYVQLEYIIEIICFIDLVRLNQAVQAVDIRKTEDQQMTILMLKVVP